MSAAAMKTLSLLPPRSQRRNVQRTRIPQLTTQKRIEIRAVELLEQHPHFRGHNRCVEFRCVENCLTLDGRLPSYYLKQLAQEAIRSIGTSFDDIQIDNLIVVPRSLEDVAPSQGFGKLEKEESIRRIPR